MSASGQTTQVIERLEQKIDGIRTQISDLCSRITRLEALPRYEQPCDVAKKMMDVLVDMQTKGCVRLQEHIKQTQEMRSDWRRALVSVVSGVLIGLLMSAATLAFKGWIAEYHRHEQKQEWKGLP